MMPWPAAMKADLKQQWQIGSGSKASQAASPTFAGAPNGSLTSQTVTCSSDLRWRNVAVAGTQAIAAVVSAPTQADRNYLAGGEAICFDHPGE